MGFQNTFYIPGNVTTVPVRLSPPVIFLTTPEKLVVEFRTSEGYGTIIWSRNGLTLGSSDAPALLSEFTNFLEIFVRQPTTTSDYGRYEASYSGSGGVGTTIIVVPSGNEN